MQKTMNRIFVILLAFVMVFTGLGISGWGIERAYAEAGEIETTFTVPAGCKVRVGRQVNYFKYDDAQAVEATDDGRYTYNLKGGKYYFVVDDGEHASYWQWVNISADNHEFSVTEEDLAKNKLNTDSILRVNERSSYDVADIYMNTNEKGFHHLQEGETFTLESFRNWQTVENQTDSNMVAEPNFHFRVLGLDGQPSETVAVEPANAVGSTAKITGKNAGTAIILVTYDAVINPTPMGGPAFSAIWPENTGVFVVQVGGEEPAVQTNMTINGEQKDKLSGAMIDAQHDVIYYLTEQINADGTVETVTDAYGEYTFTPEADSVAIANPVISDGELSFNEFKDVNANKDGSYTVRLTEGSNIVKVTKDGSSTYQIVRAKGVKVRVNNLTAPGFALAGGDKYSVTFDTLYHPASKLAGVYNQYVGTVYQHVDGYDGKTAGGKSEQYNYPQKKDAQTVGNIAEWKYEYGGGLFGYKWNCNLGEALTVPADYMGKQVSLSGGKIFSAGYGEKFGSHRTITHAVGSSMGGMANSYDAYFGQLPDIELPVKEQGNRTVSSIEIEKEPNNTSYIEEQTFDATGLELKVNYEVGKTAVITEGFTYSKDPLMIGQGSVKITYNGASADVPISVRKAELTSISVKSGSYKSKYTEGERFDPTGLILQGRYDNGKWKDLDGAEFTYDDKVLSVKDYNVRIDYGSFSANASIFVKSKEPVTDNEQITVNFSLYGDTKHGENGNIHTYKNSKDKLESWIVNADIRVNKDTTVNDVLVKALTDAGISWSNAGGNYVSSINGLSEFDNGPNSGWMYLLNGVHSKWGVAEQKVNNGDKIIFHYTDDYTKESDAENWGKPEEKLPTVGGSVDSIVKEDEATSVVKKSDMDKLISDAVKNEATVIELTVKGAEKADKITVEMPKQSVADVAEKTDVVFSVNTPLGIVSFDRKAMNEAVKQATGDTVKVVFEKLSATVTKVALTSADKEFTDLGTAKVKINLPVSDDLKDKNIAVAYTGKDGKLVKPAGKVVTIDGKKFCQIEISVIGEITLDEEAKIDELINAQDGESEEAKLAKIKDGVKNTAVKAESTAGKSKGKPYIKLNWAKSKGYKVDYFEVYKSNKKGSFSKTPYFKTKNGTAKTYKNTKELKKGIRYYYKVRGVRKVDGKKVYTKWSNVANRVSK